MKATLLLCSLILLTACSSAPVKVQYYLLDGPVANQQATEKSGPVIGLQPIVLADYLTSTSLVMMQDDQQLLFANQHQWAEPLDGAIGRVLRKDLSQLSEHQVYNLKQLPPPYPEWQLRIKVDHFTPDHQGLVTLSGQYWFYHQNQVVEQQSFSLQQRLEADGFAHAVKQQRALIKNLAEQLAPVLNKAG